MPLPRPKLPICLGQTLSSLPASHSSTHQAQPGYPEPARISAPFPLWLGLLPPVLLRLPKTGLKMKGWAEVVAPQTCEETIPSVLTQRAPRSSRGSKSQYTFS